MATFVKFAVYKPMGFPLKIHYIDTAGNPIIGADGQPMIKLLDLAKTAGTEPDGFIDLRNVLYAQAIDGYEFTSNINTNNAEESKTLVGAETGEIGGAPENRKATIGSYTGYQLRFIKYDNGTFYAAMGNRTGNNRFAITGKPAVYLTYKRVAVIYGAEWDGTSTTKWVRTDAAANFADPVPAVTGGTGSSPFDNIMPWSGMVKSENPQAGTVVAIPKFYYKWTMTGSKLKLQISTDNAAGFHVSPAHADRGDGKGERDVVYIGRYHCADDYKSKAGVSPIANISMATARSGIHALGDNVWQNDIQMRVTLWMLYLVEFADWNSPAKIGRECGNGSAPQAMGASDNMKYHTGTMQSSRNTYGVGVQYRNIESLWGNVFEWCDGMNWNGKQQFICNTPSKYKSDSITDYIFVGTNVPGAGYPTAWNPSGIAGLEWYIIPTRMGGNASSYCPCLYGYYMETSGVYGTYVGGSFSKQEFAGLFRIDCYTASYQGIDTGTRLQVLP